MSDGKSGSDMSALMPSVRKRGRWRQEGGEGREERGESRKTMTCERKREREFTEQQVLSN